MTNEKLSSRGTVRAVLVPLALFTLAAVIFRVPWRFVSPVSPATAVPAWAVNPAPVRRPTLKPELKVASYTYRCRDCHKLFSSDPKAAASRTTHTNIALKHGINDRCFNCHNIHNRNTFVDDIGGEIPFDQPQLLCAKCHGPVYRDWQHGVHGRSNGYWDTRRGPLKRTGCTECHDPHQPPFPPMKPAPPPNTLRMGPQAETQEPPAGNPLRIYDQPDTGSAATTPSSADRESGEEDQ